MFVHFDWFDQKQLFTNPNFPHDFPLFKIVKKNKLSEYFSAPFWDS